MQEQTTQHLPHRNLAAVPVLSEQETSRPDFPTDMPRTMNPQGVDDSEKIWAMGVELFPVMHYAPDQEYNRRAWYLGVINARASTRGWQHDLKASRLPPEEIEQRVLKVAH
jgi:hypothetical protein